MGREALKRSVMKLEIGLINILQMMKTLKTNNKIILIKLMLGEMLHLLQLMKLLIN